MYADQLAYKYKKSRMIEKTVRLLFFQFLFTFGCVLFTLIPIVHAIIIRNIALLLTIGSIGSFLYILYISSATEKTEQQVAVFTMFETMVICAASSMYGYDVVIMATLITIGITCALGIYALTATTDHTGWYGILYSSLTCLLAFGIMNLFFGIEFIRLIELYLGTLVFFGYIIFDVQYYLSDKMFNDIRADLHISAAINIYLDVINIFIRMLEIVSRNQTKDKKRK
jgi:FtsH-binding integral membrane protein